MSLPSLPRAFVLVKLHLQEMSQCLCLASAVSGQVVTSDGKCEPVAFTLSELRGSTAEAQSQRKCM